MKLILILFIDSHCDICKLTQDEFINNPPNCDVVIRHLKHDYNKPMINKYRIKQFPTSILVDIDRNKQICRFKGFVNSETINNKIEEYESKYMV